MKPKLKNGWVSILAGLIAILLFSGGYFLHSQMVAPEKQATNAEIKPAVKTGHIKVADLNMYYESHGSGKPIVLIHGGLSNARDDFDKIIPILAKDRRVIIIEQQGHGRTADVDRPLDYEQMANDTAAALKQLNITNADFMGYSMGSGVAVQMAMLHPELTRKLVLLSPFYNNDAFYPGALEAEKTMTAEHLKGTPFEKSYAELAPTPENWPALVEKMRRLDTEDFKGWSPEMIRSIKAPTLIVLGDSDIIRPEHIVDMFRLRGGGVPGGIPGDSKEAPESQLAILPATTHFNIVDREDWLASAVPAFLDSATAR